MPNDDELTAAEREMSLAEIVNRVLDRGAVIRGEVVIGVGGVDLIHLGLQLVIASIETEEDRLERSAAVARALREPTFRRAISD